MLNPWRGVTQTHEDLFIERYRRLLGVSLKLTGHNREQAEDLLHDAFIQFTLNRPDIDNIQNLEGYLYAMLRNMHLSNLRRTGRSQGHPVSLVEYDSAEVALLAVSHHVLISARDELRAICSYACWRKDTSKVGTVLALRFFHGYYPGEIASVIRSPRKAVDDWLHLGRREAKAYMADPDRIQAIRSPRVATSVPIEPAVNTTEFLASLRDTIFRSCQGECLSKAQLRDIYTGTDPASIGNKTLAHVVSCRSCLDEVNRLLKLDPLSDRFPTDMIGPDVSSGGGRGGHSPDERGFARAARRRSRQVFEHEPKELRVAVNGFILGSQSIGSEFNEQTINVNLSERIGFVEVFSDQEIRLLFLNVEPAPDGPIEQLARVELSEGRSLEVSLGFDDTWPRIRAIYHDPSLNPALFPEGRILDLGPAGEMDGAVHTEPERLPPRGSRVREWLLGRTSRLGSLLRPGAVTAGLAIVLIAIMVLLKLPAPVVSAAELLRRSSSAEGLLAGTPETAVRRMLTVEELRNGGVSVRRRVEVWSGGQHALKVRRVYDEKDQLIAGEWTQADGTHTVYTVGERPFVSNRESGPLDLIAPELNQYWRMEPSATQFLSLIAEPELARVEEQGDLYVVDYRPVQSGSDPALVHAVIILRKPDLHPVENRLEVMVAGELREYRLAESSFERRAIRTIGPKIFEPEPELRGLRVTGRAGGIGRVETESPVVPTNPARLSPAMLVELEIEALYKLHELGSCMREQPLLGRTEDGGLQIDIIVDGERRKGELLQALAALARRPGVALDVDTVAEAAAKQVRAPAGPTVTRLVNIRSDRIPVYDELRGYFEQRLGARSDEVNEAQLDAEIRRYANRELQHSREALRHAWALKNLTGEFSAAELSMLGNEAESRFWSMVRDHAATCRRETAALRVELEPVFFPGNLADDASDVDTTDLRRAAEQLVRIASSHEQAARAAFSISPDGVKDTVIKTDQFRRSLRSAEKLVTRILSEH